MFISLAYLSIPLRCKFILRWCQPAANGVLQGLTQRKRQRERPPLLSAFLNETLHGHARSLFARLRTFSISSNTFRRSTLFLDLGLMVSFLPCGDGWRFQLGIGADGRTYPRARGHAVALVGQNFLERR